MKEKNQKNWLDVAILISGTLTLIACTVASIASIYAERIPLFLIPVFIIIVSIIRSEQIRKRHYR